MKHVIITLISFLSYCSNAQSISLPPQANNQRSFVGQNIGIVNVSIEYSSPDVDGREGEIWGKLVPYNDGKPRPWRAGADRITKFTFSHDVKVQGKLIQAGMYGFHIIPSDSEWTLIFSKNATSWGSFTYKEEEDVLRVLAKPETSGFHEYLTYDFTVRKADHAEVELKWENLKLPIRIDVDQKEIMLTSLREEIRSISAAVSWKERYDAANYVLINDLGNYEEALGWINLSVAVNPFFLNTITKYQILEKLNRNEEASKTYDYALSLGSNEDLYRHGRQLINQGEKEEALKVFKLNAKRFGDMWPINLGLGRGYQALGENKNAFKYYKKALAQASSERQKQILSNLIKEVNK